MTEIEKKLLKITEEYEPIALVENLVYSSSDQFKPGYWTDDIPPSLLSLWDELSLESRLVAAYLVSMHHMLSPFGDE